ncbi:MAG: leucyl/phenylalanyl-tRNA--protein transferase [Spirochaetota bacterium]
MIRFLRPAAEGENEGGYVFPPPEKASREGIVCAGGNLSRGMLLSAYRQGIFPWYDESSPILWWSPDPRFIVLPSTFHIPRSARRLGRKRSWTYSLDLAFPRVIRGCASAARPGQEGTWITREMIEAYIALHESGYAHSVEVWEDGSLVGGLYGVSLGSCFFGESMFSLRSGASRAAFIRLGAFLFSHGFSLIDSQVKTDYVAGMGGVEVPRARYLRLLKDALAAEDKAGDWNIGFPGFASTQVGKGVENFFEMP